VSSSIIVLAAGASRRMGKPKPLVAFDEETCLSLVLNACFGSRADETVLVLGAEAASIAAAAGAVSGSRIGRLRTVVNEGHEKGQTSSLKVGLEASSPRADSWILFPVDQPLIRSADIDALIERFEAHPRGRTIFVAAHDGTPGHPVLLGVSHRAAILELGDDEPLHDYIRMREGETEKVSSENPGVVTGMNTPEEYQRLLALYRSNVAAAKDRQA